MHIHYPLLYFSSGLFGGNRCAEGELEGLAVWHDRNGNGVCDPGEVVPVASLGIVAISCRGEKGGHPDVAATARLGVTFRDGRSRPTFDLLMQRR
jgi:hypothetical protein